MNLKTLLNRAKEYVELEARTKVKRVSFAERFSLAGSQDIVLSVKTTDREDPDWWVVGGSTPMNLYSKRVFASADEAFSMHLGLMTRMGARNFKESRKAPSEIGYDAFISHASEDKESFVRPLAIMLQKLGCHVWYDEFTLRIGDSLRRSIDKGLVNSQFGIVVLSKAFFKKNWPKYELDGLVAREMNRKKVILPVWYGINKRQVMKYSPAIADKVACNSGQMSIGQIARALANELQAG